VSKEASQTLKISTIDQDDEIKRLKQEMRKMQEQVRMWMNKYWVERGLPEI